jgi:hypothetical protein
MRRAAIILLSTYVLIESAYLLIGNDDPLWSVAYYLNQSFLIIGILLMLKKWISTVLIGLVIGLNVLKIGYNVLILLNKDIAERVNVSFYFALIIVVSIVCCILLTIKMKKQ